MICCGEDGMSRRREEVGLFAAFLATGVAYAVVGDVAVNAHGFVRNTRDSDVFIRPIVDNAQAVFRALGSLGAPLEGMDYTDLPTGEAHYQLHTENERVDVLRSIGAMSFDQVRRNHVDAEIDGVTVHFISKEDLIENKRQVGRLIDLADAEQLALVPSDFNFAFLRSLNRTKGYRVYLAG